MRVARCFVAVDVDADHQLERVQRLRKTVAVRRREHRVAADRDQRADLALAGGFDLLSKAVDGKLAEHFAAAFGARRPAVDLHSAAAARLALRVWRAGRRLREHHSTGAVEVAGQRVDHVDQPARDGAEGLRCRADPAVDGGARRGRQLARDPADRFSLNAATRGDGFGRERLRCLLNLFNAAEQPVKVITRRH